MRFSPRGGPAERPPRWKESATVAGDYYRELVSGRRHGWWPGLLRSWLWTASVPYGLATRWRNGRYDRGARAVRVPVPVVSVGNLTLGGTGKTPCVEYVARFYRDLGRRVAILSRGYGGGHGRNDEALLLEQNLPGMPHLQGGDRVALAGEAIEKLHCDVLVLDDGFQHRRLARDLDVVLVDATDPWGQGHFFPRGLLRENPAGLNRASSIIVTRCDHLNVSERGRLREAIARLAPEVPVAEARHQPLHLVNGDHATAALDSLRGRPLAAFCGIGNPEAFRRTLTDLGSDLRLFRVFPDHHAYSPRDREDLRAWAARLPKEGLVVTTQKDLVKLRRAELGGRGLWALRICLAFDAGQATLEGQLREVLARTR